MKLLPHDAFTVVTADPPPIVLKRLMAVVEPIKLLRFSRNHALLYEGIFSDQGFCISRIIDYRNDLKPLIRGRFEQQVGGTAVHLQMSLHPFAAAFLAFWYLFWYSATIPITLAGAMPDRLIALFLGMPILALIVFSLSFWSEVKHSRHELTQIIQGDTITVCA